MRFVVFLALLLGLSSAFAQTRYRAPGLTYITSIQPISSQHAACLKFEDDHISWMKRNQAKVKTPAMKEIYEKELAILLSGDNEVPTKEELEELESLLRVDLHRAALERERQRTKEAAGNPALQTMLDMATRYDSVLLAEESYLWQLAWQRYIDCVKASGIAK